MADYEYNISIDFSSLNTTVAYGTSSTKQGRAEITFSPSSSAISSVDILDINRIGSDVSHFGPISAQSAYPITMTQSNSSILFDVIFDNSYAHANTETFTVSGYISAGNISLDTAANPASSVTTQVEWESTGYTVTALGDSTAPSAITGFTATVGDEKIALAWTNPTDPDYAGTIIRSSTTSFPTTTAQGTLVYEGTGTSKLDTGLNSNLDYYYSAFAYDTFSNISSPATAIGSPTFLGYESVNRWAALYDVGHVG